MPNSLSLDTQKGMNNKANTAVIMAATITLILYIVPFLSPLAYPFVLISTLAHEAAHGLAALMVGGDFHSLAMYSDGSGVARISGHFGRFSRAFVAGAGLIGPAIVSALFFSATKSLKRSRTALCICSILLSIALVLLIRNFFAIFFVAVVIGSCFFFSLGAGKNYAQTFLAFLAAELALSVFSRSDYLFTKTANTSLGPMPSDVAQIAEALFLPYWFWGALCGLFSLLALFYGIKTLIK